VNAAVDSDDRFISTKGDLEGDVKDIVHRRPKLSCLRQIHRRGNERRIGSKMVYDTWDVNEWITLTYDEEGSTY
jgi:hypothetical protein